MDTFLGVLREFASHADHRTGRNIVVAHAVAGHGVGRGPKTVQRCRHVAEQLGLLQLVLTGCDMSLGQRIAVIGHYSRRTRGARWRTLPNIYAAVMPAIVTRHAPRQPARQLRVVHRAVDRTRWSAANVHLPEGSTRRLFTSCTTPKGPLLNNPCGHTPPPTNSKDNNHRTAAPRPTEQPQQHKRRRVRLDPAVEAYARTFRAMGLGRKRLSLHRICPGLTPYLRAGISPEQLYNGLADYLVATGTTWHTLWDDDADHARYLIGMLKRARLAGYITPW